MTDPQTAAAAGAAAAGTGAGAAAASAGAAAAAAALLGGRVSSRSARPGAAARHASCGLLGHSAAGWRPPALAPCGAELLAGVMTRSP